MHAVLIGTIQLSSKTYTLIFHRSYRIYRFKICLNNKFKLNDKNIKVKQKIKQTTN